MRVVVLIVVAALTLAGSPAWASAETPGILAGQITNEQTPLAAAKVYAYQLADSSLRTVLTDGSGRFLFDQLPAGLYKVIAYKVGFIPAVVMLTRTSPEASQFLEVDLTPERLLKAAKSKDFWSLREQIPSDVLRDMENPEGTVVATVLQSEAPSSSLLSEAKIAAEMQAVAGVDNRKNLGDAYLTGGRLDVRGRYRDVEIGVSGELQELESEELAQSVGDLSAGRTQAVSLRVEGAGDSKVHVSSTSNSLVSTSNGAPAAVDFEHHRVTWSQNYGRRGRSDFTAHYTSENNFYNSGSFEPLGLPEASESWQLEGSYTTEIADHATVEAGVKYRERTSNFSLAHAGLPLTTSHPDDRVDLFGRGGVEINSGVVVEYGLFSTLRDGSLSMVPRGGIVLSLGPNWRASTSISHRLSQEDENLRRDFIPTYFNEGGTCDQQEEYCYEILVSREWGEGESFSVGAVHREIAETLRLYFDQDFFDLDNSLYLVRGDELPEVQLSLTRRITPSILTRVRSTVASGGGGLVFGADRLPYDNEFSYLITSVDTQFERSSTGVFLLFHQIEQELTPAGLSSARKTQRMEMERVQLMLTQDLDMLESLASHLAFQLNMELSRGGGIAFDDARTDDEDEIRKRIMGGVAVKF